LVILCEASLCVVSFGRRLLRLLSRPRSFHIESVRILSRVSITDTSCFLFFTWQYWGRSPIFEVEEEKGMPNTV